MLLQHDPFRNGDSLTSAQLNGSVAIVNLATGYSCMSILSSFHLDWSLLKGRIGCRPGAFTLYFGCRYMASMSMLSTMVYLNAFFVTSLDSLRYLAQVRIVYSIPLLHDAELSGGVVLQVTGSIALGLAYSVLLIRIAAIYEKLWLSAVLDLLMLFFWGIIWKTVTEASGEHQHLGFEFAMAVYRGRDIMPSIIIYEHSVERTQATTHWYALLQSHLSFMQVVTLFDRDPTGFANFVS
ncbi:hypothetical protein BN946_scf184813.g3 [Trametes cinnabarina]|uniref:Uncharacterized protein n=1 Tax=Pycnoporus cinnabarinus TaxID=5643 RepID=A0A060SW67_PYCCI|nr:hypothetical protein BN946_scf184813.g3 [Trametes cinnabarina]